MGGEERRKMILELLDKEQRPLSGARLSKLLGVSRQIVVQDIALLKLKRPALLSTARGYVMNDSVRDCETVFWVKHTDEQIEDELNTIIDLGGRVENVIVEHNVYGRIIAELHVSSRRDVRVFLDKLKREGATPLKELTGGTHGHLVLAKEEDVLNEIAQELSEKGYLIADKIKMKG
ncbi:MAG: transcription repressor NadR [Synergistaceae bacterium]|nr:transcription repressor NadR [Synergistaceae bacterium]